MPLENKIKQRCSSSAYALSSNSFFCCCWLMLGTLGHPQYKFEGGSKMITFLNDKLVRQQVGKTESLLDGKWFPLMLLLILRTGHLERKKVYGSAGKARWKENKPSKSNYLWKKYMRQFTPIFSNAKDDLKCVAWSVLLGRK